MEDPIKYKIKNSHYYKFGGIAPDGFTLIPNETLERLTDFDNWAISCFIGDTFETFIEDMYKKNKQNIIAV